MTCRICSAPESRAEWAIEGNSESEIGLCQCEKRCIWEGNKPMTIRPPGCVFCRIFHLRMGNESFWGRMRVICAASKIFRSTKGKSERCCSPEVRYAKDRHLLVV